MYKLSIFDDKYYKKYIYLFNYSLYKFNLINYYLLNNYTNANDNKICNYLFDKNYKYYNAIFIKNMYGGIYKTGLNLNFDHYIITNIKKNKKTLYIQSCGTIIKNDYLLKNKNMGDLLYYDKYHNINFYNNYIKKEIIKIVNENLYNNLYLLDTYEIYKQFLNNLKNNKEENNILIPKKQYEVITCNFCNGIGVSLTASYKMNFNLPYVISNIAIVFKTIVKGGTLLLFWSIVNINIPIIKKILALLIYSFNNIEIIDNDINQNLLIGVPEYYITCSGYKDNINDDLINKLLDISCDALEYIYKTCDILYYYEDYTIKNPNNTIYYNKIEEEFKNIYNMKKTKKSSTRKSSTRKASNRSIIPIYYIEDINIPELDKIMKDKKLMFKVDSLANKLETIFIGYFEMVNNLIVNAIAKDKNGNMYVKSNAILKKDITNLTKLISIFEYHKLPYNKHALKVLLNKKNEILSHFYSLDNPVNIKLIQYDDKTSKYLNINALNNFVSYEYLQKPYDLDILNDYYNRISLSLQVKNKLLEDIPNTINAGKDYIKYASYDFSINLCDYLNDKYKNIHIKVNNTFLKIWEILSQFNLIPYTLEKKSLKILYLDEFSGQIIMCVNHWLSKKCNRFNMENYEWLANSLNMSHTHTNKFHNKLIKDNYDRWIFGEDNTGNLTNIENIKSIVNELNNKWSDNEKQTHVDLIISDGSLEFNPNVNTLNNQKIELSKVISIIASCSVGSSCCSKHFIPSKTNDQNNQNENDTTIDSTNFFIGYLYLYYIMFDSLTLYKPNSSESDSREFYVIGKKFKGITDHELKNLYNILDYYVFNSAIIEKEKIPITFVYQINNFLEDMSNINILSIEKQNLLLTCFKNLYAKDSNSNNNIHSDSYTKKKTKKISQQYNKILKCDNFFNKKKMDTISIPKYREWIKIFDFE